ncbi:MAG: 50S ribosomal protein L21 [Planctomycetota bacterium]|nr:50S ribosomal protein L21 [Planctomycetota bacterium]
MQKAIIKTGGKQYTVGEGDELCVELLDAEVGGEVDLGEVLMLVGDTTKVGKPTVAGAKVLAKVLAEVKGPKTRCVFFRRRKDSRTCKGHRQKYLKVKITGIAA